MVVVAVSTINAALALLAQLFQELEALRPGYQASEEDRAGGSARARARRRFGEHHLALSVEEQASDRDQSSSSTTSTRGTSAGG